MKKVTLLMALIMFCSWQFALAQRTITGTVTDAKDGSSIPGVNIVVKGTTTGTVTDINGAYSLKVIGNDQTLIFTFVGYESKEVAVGNLSVIDVTLSVLVEQLEGVVVTALGVQKSDKRVGYAISTIKGEDIIRTNTINPITALQGKVAGVNVNVTAASGVQSSPFIQIRGAKVLGGPGKNSNQPIFVKDGIVLDNNVQDADNADLGSQLKNLNPDDYESITVLKGAAATSLYGSRGINGAVVITSKKGKAGKGLGIEFNETFQTANIYKSPMAYQNSYGQGSWATREGAFKDNGTQATTMGSWGPAYDGSMKASVIDPTNPDNTKFVPYVAIPDNWETFYQDGLFINHNIALTGGSEKFNFRLSYSNNNSKGNLPNNEMTRNSFDLNIRGELNKVFSSEFGVSYSNTQFQNWVSQGRYYWQSGQNLAFNTYYLPRNLDVASWYTTYRNPDNSVDGTYGNLSAVLNAFSTFDKNNSYQTENSLLGHLMIKAQVLPWVDLSAKGNINLYNRYSEVKNMGNGKNNAGGYYSSGGNYSSNYNLLFMAHAKKNIINENFTADLSILNEIYGNMKGESFGASTNGGLKVPNQFFLGNTMNNNQNNIYYSLSKPSQLTIGVGGILDLNYKDFVNLELTARNDWISTLTYPTSVIGGANNYSVFYPSVNLSYSFYSQYQDKMPSWLSSGRLRASLAYVGNSGVAGPYSTGNGYSPGSTYDQNGTSVSMATMYNASVQPNLNLKPQVQRSWEFGTNFGVFKELVNIDFTWYQTNTFDQLITLPGVPETGYSTVYMNAGNIQNKGIEALVIVTPIRRNNLVWDIAVNMGSNKSKIVEFGMGIKEWELSGGYDGANVYATEGGDFGILTSDNWASAKIDTKTGWPLIEVGSVLSSPGSYNLQTYWPAAPDDKQKIGKVEPDLTGGISTNLRYKNFSLFVQADARFGGYVYSEALNYAMGQGTSELSLEGRDAQHGGVKRIDSYTGLERYDGIIPDAVFDEGQKSPKTGADLSGMTFKQAYDQGLVDPIKASAYYVNFYGWGTNINNNQATCKNSWVMLREISLGYNLPSELAQKIFLKGARVNVGARNIGYLYKTLTGDQNPESLQGNDPFRPYITGGVPFTRNFYVKLQISL